MNQFNFPTTILLGENALEEFVNRLKDKKHKKILIVTDKTLYDIGIIKNVTHLLSLQRINFDVFHDVHPNPNDLDVENGLEFYKSSGCDSIIGIGGGSPLDVAKVIKIMATNPPPLSQYDDALGGDSLIKNPMPPLYAIPTTAGTGSEVGRSGIIIMRATGHKTIFFHPHLIPDIAVLDPIMTVELPPHITAATGIDAFSHCLEAYFAQGFHPMADGIALQGIELVIEWLPQAYKDGKNKLARERMLIAAAMGATAFQKGLGMIHSLAHPLSSLYDMHHGLANALMLPSCVDFLEKAKLNSEQKRRISKINNIFAESDYRNRSLAHNCRDFFASLGIEFGLSKHKINEQDLEKLSKDAFQDQCHSYNMIPVSQIDLFNMYKAAF